MTKNKVVHILRYGTVADKLHIRRAISSFDYLCINANTAAYVSNAISSLIVENFFSNKEKGFFIDPITYAFQDRIDLLFSVSKTGERKIKKSIQKLINIYGLSYDNFRKEIPLKPEDLQIEESKDFAKRVLEFQYRLVNRYVQENDLLKYIEYATLKNGESIPQLIPKFLIPPYFYLDCHSPDWEKWLNLNIELINESIRIASIEYRSMPIFAQIVLNKDVLTDMNFMRRVTESYSLLKCDGFTLWIDDFNEHSCNKSELEGYVKLLKSLPHKPVYNMYGGYFSILLSHKSVGLLKGISHGLEYGETRKVYPVGGGIPVSKYYYLPLHRRIDFTQAFYLLNYRGIINTDLDKWGPSDKYFSEICHCTQCKKILHENMINFVEFESTDYYEIRVRGQIQRRKKASQKTRENCLYHYLMCKAIEFKRVEDQSMNKLLDGLKIARENYIDCENFSTDEFSYLVDWKMTIEGEYNARNVKK